MGGRVTPVENPQKPRLFGAQQPLPSRVLVAVLTLLVGAAVLGWAARIPVGDTSFYLVSLLLSAIWAGGGLAVGGVRWRGKARQVGQSVVRSAVVGALLIVAFIVGAVLAAQVTWLRAPAQAFLDHSAAGWLPMALTVAMVTGLAEEMFFRGGLFDLVGPDRGVWVTTAAYTLVTAATGIWLLVIAAAVLGLVVGQQRKVSAGILAPVVIHLTWSLGMLFLLPPVFSWAA